MKLLEFSWLNLIVCRFWCIVLGLYVWKGLRFNSYLFAGMMSLGKFFIINVLNQLNACKICLELWTFIIYMTCIGGNFSAFCIKSAKAGQTIYSCMSDSEFRICERLKCGYMLDHRSLQFRQSVFEYFRIIALLWLLVYLYVFFSFLFAALVANKVINVFVHGKSLDKVIAKANNSLAANKLGLSVDKTSHSVFGKP